MLTNATKIKATGIYHLQVYKGTTTTTSASISECWPVYSSFMLVAVCDHSAKRIKRGTGIGPKSCCLQVTPLLQVDLDEKGTFKTGKKSIWWH